MSKLQSNLPIGVEKLKRSYVRKQKPDTFRFVGGPRARSRNGCLSCKKRSKKCDETKPICGLCVQTKRECNWPENVKKTPLEMTQQEFQIHFQEHQKQQRKFRTKKSSTDYDLTSSIHSINESNKSSSKKDSKKTTTSENPPIIVTTFPSAGMVSPNLTPIDINGPNTEFNVSSLDQLDFKSNPELTAVDNVRRFIKSVNQVRSCPEHIHNLSNSSTNIEVIKHKERMKFDKLQEMIQDSLTEVETENLNFFCITASKLCFLDAHFNRFLDSILLFAESNKILRKSILVWGAVSKNKLFDSQLEEIDEGINEALSNITNDDSFDSFVGCLSSCLLLAKLSSFPDSVDYNDTIKSKTNWFDYLIKAKELIIAFKVLDNLNNLGSQIQILVSFFSFQELHSSYTYFHGTLLDTHTTKQLWGITHTETYPPVNTIEPLLYTIPELLELRNQWKTEGFKMIQDPNKVHNHIYTEKLNTLNYKSIKLDKTIYSTQPIKTDLSFIQIEDFEIHLSLYELYQFTLQLSLRNTVRKYPPKVPENQILLMKMFNLLKYFTHIAHVNSSILWPFIVAGCNTIYEKDKELVLDLLNTLKNQVFDVATVEKIEFLIKECWERNGGGNEVINWFDLANENGWCLNLS